MWTVVNRPLEDRELSFQTIFSTRSKTYLHDNSTKPVSRIITFIPPLSYKLIDEEIHYLTNDDDLAHPTYPHQWVELEENGQRIQPPSNTLSKEERLERLQLVYSALLQMKQDATMVEIEHYPQQRVIKTYEYYPWYTLWIYYVTYIILLGFLSYKAYQKKSAYISVLLFFFIVLGVMSFYI